jgi:hypothetical protein
LSKIIGVDQLGEAIAKELTIYGENVIEGIKNEAKRYMSALVKETKATAPVGKRQKHYRDSIKSKKTMETARAIEYTWYVDGSDYRLSHLLEKGHALRDGGRTTGTHFIQKASDPIIEEYLEQVEDIIKGGGY